MYEIFLAAIQEMIGTLLDRLSPARAAKIDNLNDTITSRAAADTALSAAVWTDALAGALLEKKQRAPTAYSGGGNTLITHPSGSAAQPLIGSTSALSGVMTANALKTGLNVTGAGVLNYVALTAQDATQRTIRVKVTIDGDVIVDPGMSAAITVVNKGIVPVGSLATYNDGMSNIAAVIPAKLSFNTSLLVEIASSLSETDKLRLFTAHEVH